MESFATVESLKQKYELTETQAERAQSYLDDVTLTITELLAQRGKSPEEISDEILELVTRDVAYRALSSIKDGAVVSQYTQSAIGYSETFSFSTQSGDIYLTKKEKQLLGLCGSRLYSIRPHIGCVGDGDDW